MSQKRTVLAEYFITDEQVLLFVMRDDFTEPEVIPIDKTLAEIQEFVKQNFQSETDSEERVVKSTGEKVRRLDEDAFQDFFAPLVAPLVSNSNDGTLRTNEGDQIWLVPYDVLHYLPLHALKVEGRHLIERNPVSYSPSASIMKYCHRKQSGALNKALVVGDSLGDLPHAREEAITVADLFGAPAHLGQQASKSFVTEIIQREHQALDVLHFSCHGYFDSSEALKSGIMLAREQADNNGPVDQGRWNLTVEEIFGLEINADLVTLSACESGVSERRRGDELIGLTRALIQAGIPSLVVSLWTVNDISTGLLMREFYNKLREPTTDDGRRVTKAEALQLAQKHLLGLTVRDVVDYCETRLERFTGPEQFRQAVRYRIDKANLQVIAGDLRPAIASYKEIRKELEAHTEQWATSIRDQIDSRLPAVEIKLEDAPPKIDFAAHPYQRLYYWAPFVLVGNWN